MTRKTTSTYNKEATQMRKLIAVALIAVAIVALAAAPALAEGYNDGGVNFNTGLDSGVYAGNAGLYTRTTGYFSGPHGGYTTTTNKCQDCHSTHYATGSYKLLRASAAGAACDFCHGGGGGSTVNIMMDNAYTKVVGDDVSDGVADLSATNGPGTGHTLGYAGSAPADIKPAFSAGTDGFACFNCHSPHGNSARIMTTFSNPGRAMGKSSSVVATSAGGVGNSDGTLNSSGEWGVDPQHGNLKWFGDPYAGKTWATGRPSDDGTSAATTSYGRVIYRPIWPSGRFLLLKNPDRETNGSTTTEVLDTVVAPVGTTADNGVNKYMINWDEPMGPADGGYGGYQDNDSDQPFLFAPVVGGQGGFLSLSEFCTDCHDGTAGASTQPANVYKPGTPGDGYMVAYSHDAQPRH